ncbi:hypothetical protein C4559_02500 [Candidatus Microgenomates bacterium]|nr:MAG: hypothetical protein C4559_02500 [Candidatus Microgenomates bacterium]
MRQIRESIGFNPLLAPADHASGGQDKAGVEKKGQLAVKISLMKQIEDVFDRFGPLSEQKGKIDGNVHVLPIEFNPWAFHVFERVGMEDIQIVAVNLSDIEILKYPTVGVDAIEDELAGGGYLNISLENVLPGLQTAPEINTYFPYKNNGVVSISGELSGTLSTSEVNIEQRDLILGPHDSGEQGALLIVIGENLSGEQFIGQLFVSSISLPKGIEEIVKDGKVINLEKVGKSELQTPELEMRNAVLEEIRGGAEALGIFEENHPLNLAMTPKLILHGTEKDVSLIVLPEAGMDIENDPFADLYLMRDEQGTNLALYLDLLFSGDASITPVIKFAVSRIAGRRYLDGGVCTEMSDSGVVFEDGALFIGEFKQNGQSEEGVMLATVRKGMLRSNRKRIDVTTVVLPQGWRKAFGKDGRLIDSDNPNAENLEIIPVVDCKLGTVYVEKDLLEFPSPVQTTVPRPTAAELGERLGLVPKKRVEKPADFVWGDPAFLSKDELRDVWERGKKYNRQMPDITYKIGKNGEIIEIFEEDETLGFGQIRKEESDVRTRGYERAQQQATRSETLWENPIQKEAANQRGREEREGEQRELEEARHKMAEARALAKVQGAKYVRQDRQRTISANFARIQKKKRKGR